MPHIILKSSLDHLSFLDSRDEKPIFNPETLSVTYTPLGKTSERRGSTRPRLTKARKKNSRF